MFCSNCGAEIHGGKFCSTCGSPIYQSTEQTSSAGVSRVEKNGHAIKICSNCGDRLLEKAIKCPTCGTKAKNFPIIDSEDTELISQIISEAPNPKGSTAPNWKKRLEVKSKIWYGDSSRLKAQADTRISENNSNAIACCPKCGSTSLSANKKGFGIGKAIVGASVAPIGLIAGNINAKKVRVTCLNCGHQFWPGK